jgi:hypothetical protein
MAPSAVTPPPSESPNPEPAGPPLPPDPRFGDPGQLVFDGGLTASIGHLGYSASGTSLTSLSISPAVDHFSKANMSEGLSALFRYSDTTFGPGSESHTVTYGLGGQVGINFWLGERVSFWPKLGLSGLRSKTTSTSPPLTPGGSTTTTTTTTVATVQIDAPFLFHVATHFFIGFGPFGYADILNSTGTRTDLRRSFGASSTIGGWL